MTEENHNHNPKLENTANEIKRTLNILVVATVVLFFCLIGSVAYTYFVSRNNRDALCAYRADLESRIATGSKFLKDHPTGIPTAGISSEALQSGIDSQKHAVKAFQEVNCP